MLSALFLGLYDITKKLAVKNNAVPPVLLLNVMFAAALWTPIIWMSSLSPSMLTQAQSAGDSAWLARWQLAVAPIDMVQHLQVAFKSLIVGISWTAAFAALHRLPISVASPIRATGPVWTISFATLLMGERPSFQQWVGLSIIVLAFLAFSRVSRTEGISFHRDRSIWLMYLATLSGSASALYDKYLLQTVGLHPATVQAWFSIYLVPVMLPWYAWWRWSQKSKTRFAWRHSIPLIALFLLLSDFLYFQAVSDPNSLISIISPVRRTSIIVAFVAGVTWFGELNWRPKLLCIIGLLLGVFVISFR